MARPKTYEESLLEECRILLDSYSPFHEQQLLVLEGLSSLCGGFSFQKYCELFAHDCSDTEKILSLADEIKNQLKIIGLPCSIGISILAREPLSASEQKEKGAFYTDFRLSRLIGKQVENHIAPTSDLADISSGTGILLSGVCERYAKKYPKLISGWVASHVYAYDLSAVAIRGTIAALSCYLSKISDVHKLSKHCLVQDSLLVKKPYFDIVVGNPPWGRIKLSRYAFSLQSNIQQVYGGEYSGLNWEKFDASRERVSRYAKLIREKYNLIGTSEPDMYMAFLQEGMSCLRQEGVVAILVPAGFIRSQGMESFRRKLFNDLHCTSIVLLDNKAKFFSIDTRFKFLLLSGVVSKQQHDKWFVSYSRGNVAGRCVKCSPPVYYSREELKQIRKDLSVPECSTEAEKALFTKICANGEPMSEFIGNVKITRELDMTLDREKFCRSGGGVPLVEGRMVQAFRFGAKAYVSGEGRKAKWVPTSGEIIPQFYARRESLPINVIKRLDCMRAGFCDIAGQTNERGMMSAIIPRGVVCGNKVPTLLFDGTDGEDRLMFWVGVTNSFVFDWMLRRVLTTTVNVFLLNGLPFPRTHFPNCWFKTIVDSSKELSNLNQSFYLDNRRMSCLRATIDACVLKAYRLEAADMRLIINDFPLLDRKQPPIGKERKSTITRDMILSFVCVGAEKKQYKERVEEARRLGAKAYIPYEMRSLTQGGI